MHYIIQESRECISPHAPTDWKKNKWTPPILLQPHLCSPQTLSPFFTVKIGFCGSCQGQYKCRVWVHSGDCAEDKCFQSFPPLDSTLLHVLCSSKSSLISVRGYYHHPIRATIPWTARVVPLSVGPERQWIPPILILYVLFPNFTITGE